MTSSRILIASRPQYVFPFLDLTFAARRSSFPVALTALLVAFPVGCASPRPPRPPSLNLPQIITDLRAERVGERTELRWTTPERTTDRLNIKGAMTASICRIVFGSGSAPGRSTSGSISGSAAALASVSTPGSQVCTPVTRLTVAPGPALASDPLPAALLSNPPSLLGYRVELLNSRGHSAGLSPILFAAAGPAPSAVESLQAEAVPEGARLHWQRQNSTAAVELNRELIAPANTHPVKPPGVPSAVAPPPSPNSKRPARASAEKPLGSPGNAAKDSSEEKVRLTTPTQRSDPGGTLDTSAARGATYRYTAERVFTVSLDGRNLTLHSLPSPPVTVLLRDTFPPAVPTGLEAAPGGNASGGQAADHSIDLSWTPNTEPDLAGYLVYRRQISASGTLDGPVTRLNETPLPAPAYRDHTAVPGQRYAYQITAIDTSGNESTPSTAVEETIRQP